MKTEFTQQHQEKLRLYYKEYGINQGLLAKKIGLGQSRVSQLLTHDFNKGRLSVDDNVIKRISQLPVKRSSIPRLKADQYIENSVELKYFLLQKLIEKDFNIKRRSDLEIISQATEIPAEAIKELMFGPETPSWSLKYLSELTLYLDVSTDELPISATEKFMLFQFKRVFMFLSLEDLPAEQSEKLLTMWHRNIKIDSIVDSPKAGRESLQLLSYMNGPSPQGVTHNVYDNLAAGFGGELEPLKSDGHIPEYGNRTDISLFRVIGDSMENTLAPGDIIAAQEIQGHIELKPMDDKNGKIPLNHVRPLAPDKHMYIIDLNGSGLSVKRVNYQGQNSSWFLTLSADNSAWELENGFPRILEYKDGLTIYSRILGKVRMPGAL